MQQSQIIIGLLVTQSGLPLSYNVFAGKRFEGKTMLSFVEGFLSKHPHAKPNIVADVVMLDDERLAELRAKKISYFVGARLVNANLNLVQLIHGSLKKANGAIVRL